MKFNDKQLSSILTAHANGGLRRNGTYYAGYPGCIYQIAMEIMCNIHIPDDASADVVNWFDENYDKKWTEDQFLQYLTNQGVV
jgi:hypothetical protein